MKDFLAPYVEMWNKYFEFEGTTQRRNFWLAVLVNFLIECIISVLIAIPVVGRYLSFISSIYGLVTIIPFLALGARRLSDAGKSVYNLLWYLLPIAGWIVLVVYFCQPSVATAQPAETKSEEQKATENQNTSEENK